MNLIELHDISKTFYRGKNSIVALDEIDLSVQAGEFVSVMGKSGCGKTTLLHILAGLEAPDSGEYYFKGQNLFQLSSKARNEFRSQNIGLVVQHFALIPNYTVEENIALPLKYKHISKKEQKEIIETLLVKLELTGKEKAYPKELSGGQCQRVAIARAMITKPPVILADEPTGELDSKTGARIFEILQALHRKGHTILVVTHDATIKQYSTMHYEMCDGRIME